MTTDAQRREATDLWAIQLREQQIRELQAQLTAATAERDDYRARFRDLEHELQLERGQVVAQQQRREAAEAALVRANDKIKQLEQRLGIYST